MKAVLASVFAALFALAAVAAHAAVPAPGSVVYSDDKSKDEAKSPTDGTEKKADEDDKKKPEEDDKKS